MVILRVKQNEIAGLQVLFLALPTKLALSALDKADDIKIMEKIRELLDDACFISAGHN